MSVCVCQSQPWKHRKLETSHRLTHCTTQKDKTCKTSNSLNKHKALSLDKTASEIQDETQQTKDEYSKHWYLLFSELVHPYGSAWSCGNSPF